jgi:hypothetical protein
MKSKQSEEPSVSPQRQTPKKEFTMSKSQGRQESDATSPQSKSSRKMKSKLSEEPSPYPKAHTTKEGFTRPKSGDCQDANASSPKMNSNQSEEPSAYPQAQTTKEEIHQQQGKKEKQKVALHPSLEPLGDPRPIDDAQKDEIPEKEQKKRETPKLFAFLRKETSDGDARQAPLQGEPDPDNTREKGKPERPTDVPQSHSQPLDEAPKEKPRLLSFLQKKTNGNHAPEDSVEADERVPYPKPHTTREEFSRRREKIDAEFEVETSNEPVPASELPDAQIEQVTPSGREAPKLLSFLRKSKEETSAPPEPVPANDRHPYPEAHTTKEKFTRPKSIEAPVADEDEREVLCCSKTDRPRSAASLFSFRKKKAEENDEQPVGDDDAELGDVPSHHDSNDDRAKAPENEPKRSIWPFQRKSKIAEQECAPVVVHVDDAGQPYPPLHSDTAKQSLDRQNGISTSS